MSEATFPPKYKKTIALLEEQLTENKLQSESEDKGKPFKRKTPFLKPVKIFAEQPLEVIKYFMLEYKLMSLKDIGDFCGVSRQRIDVIMNKERGEKIEFSKLKSNIKLTLNPPIIPASIEDLKGEKWALIKSINNRPVDGHYEVSNLGRVTKTASRKVRNTLFTQRKLINCSPNKNGRVRVHFRFLGNPKNATLYTNRVVAAHFVINPNPDKLSVVSHKNGDLSDSRSENLFWESKSDSLSRNRKNKK